MANYVDLKKNEKKHLFWTETQLRYNKVSQTKNQNHDSVNHQGA